MSGTLIVHTWLLAHFALFRVTLFDCCLAYWLVGYGWFRPRPLELRAAIMASWVQCSAGVVADLAITHTGAWRYRPMPLTLAGIPLDLHVDWALIWGFLLLWTYSRLRCYLRGPRFIGAYLAAWTLFTLGFDAGVARSLLFLQSAGPYWWLADTLFLLSVQALTLWVYHTIIVPPRRPILRAWCCALRSALYLTGLIYLFYIYLPWLILSLTDGWNVHAWLGMDQPARLVLAAATPAAVGAWAVVEFCFRGLGTPVPLDPPLRLVYTGPYALIRNPMQVSGVGLALVLALRYPTPYLFIYAVDMTLLSLLLFARFETREVTERFGDSYRAYRARVRNWTPALSSSFTSRLQVGQSHRTGDVSSGPRFTRSGGGM